MNITPYDLVVLHKNVDREVGKEIFPNKTLANNDMEIMKSIENLLRGNLIVKTNEFDISIHKKKLPELREVLKNSGYKTTGTKPILINRISENFDNIENFDLPYVYTATEKGEEILKDTKYLLSFVNDSTSVARAHYIAENYIDKNCEDKVAEIYKFEFQRRYENEEFKINYRYCYELDSLIWHYEKEMQDYDNARKYLNIFYCLGFKKFLEDLINTKYRYYDDRGNLDLDEIQNDLKGMIDSYRPSIYERLILIDNLSNEAIFELFKKDTHI